MLLSKTKRIGEEFHTLKRKNPALTQLILDLTDFVRVEFSKDLMMTMIFRTQQEQWDLYTKTDGPKTKRISPHMLWNAVDIRDWIYTPQEKQKITKFLQTHYDKSNRMSKLGNGSRTVWLHKIKGQAMHFHIQYNGPLVYVFSEGMTISA